MTRRSPRLALGALCVALAAVQVYSFHWGVVTPDTVVQYGQALSGRYDDWHPPVTAWLWRHLLRLGPGGAPFLLFDVALYWGALGLIAGWAGRRHGAGGIGAVLLIGLLPIPFGQAGALLKDPLLACLLLFATALLVRREPKGPWWLAILAVPPLAIAAATRFNAPFAAMPLLLLALPKGWTARPLHIVASATICLAALFAGGWAINEAMLRPSHSHPLYSLINFDLAGIVAQGGGNHYPGVDDRTARTITARCYDERLYGIGRDGICTDGEAAIDAYVARTGESVAGIWLNAVIGDPLAYLRHRLAHLNWNWRLRPPAIPDDAVYLMSQPNTLGLHFTPNDATMIVVRAARWMAWSPLGRPATWLAVALGLLIVAPRLPSRRLVTALSLSALFYGGAYAVASVAADMRYNLWTLLAGALALVLTLLEARAAPLWRLGLALLPAALAILFELQAMPPPPL